MLEASISYSKDWMIDVDTNLCMSVVCMGDDKEIYQNKKKKLLSKKD